MEKIMAMTPKTPISPFFIISIIFVLSISPLNTPSKVSARPSR